MEHSLAPHLGSPSVLVGPRGVSRGWFFRHRYNWELEQGKALM
jgi:hypothetical protein